ncbi:DUF6192 family protein [Streptomyces mirabilis]|uniref:DUF6192 family protein n=1 Tax=Streptomyces mirabilis TaxID=68239 RepID=UPI0036DC7CE2
MGVARTAMRDDTARMLVNRAQVDDSPETRDRTRERTQAARAIEHTTEYLDLVGSCTGSWPPRAGWSPSCGAVVRRLTSREGTDPPRGSSRRPRRRWPPAADEAAARPPWCGRPRAAARSGRRRRSRGRER